MSLTASSTAACDGVAALGCNERLEVLFAELAQLAGQRNAIDGRIVEIAAEMERDELCGATGARSVAALVAWKTGCSPANAQTITAIAGRLEQFPRCAAGMKEGWLSLDQVGVIAARAGAGSDEHYAQLARVATVSQLRTAVKLEPRPEPDPRPEPQGSIAKTTDEQFSCWRIKLAHHDTAKFDAALASYREALISEWKHDHGPDTGAPSDCAPPLPGTLQAFMQLIETGWDAEATRRPHGQCTTVVVHLDVAQRRAALHLGPLLSDVDRGYLSCDATCEAWFERDGQLIGAGRTTRVINRRLRRALQYRDRTCVVPGCGATRGLHAHHIHHWEDGGATELDNLVPLSPPRPPPRHHHHQRARRQSRRQRPHRPRTAPRITGTPTNPTPTRSIALPGTQRRTRPMVVVRPLPTPHYQTPTSTATTGTETQTRWSIKKLVHTTQSPTKPGCQLDGAIGTCAPTPSSPPPTVVNPPACIAVVLGVAPANPITPAP